MEHIPREISRLSYFFMEEGGSPIPAGGLEVPLLLTFSIKRERIFKLKKSFVNHLHDDDYTGEKAENNEEESGDDENSI